MIQSQVPLLGLLPLAVLLSGCGSVIFNPNQEIRPECSNVPTAGFSAPAVGAGCRSGQVMRLDRRQDHTIIAKADGYESQTLQLESQVSILRAAVSVVFNGIVGAPTLWILTPFLCAIDIRAGAWQVLEPAEVVVELQRTGDEAGAAAAWPSPTQSRSAYCPSCGATSGATKFCAACGQRLR